MKKATTIQIGSTEYPLFKTMRGMVDFERSHHTQEDLQSGKFESVLFFMFCMTKGACVRDGVSFDLDFEGFIDQVDPGAIGQLSVLKDEQEEAPTLKDETAKLSRTETSEKKRKVLP